MTTATISPLQPVLPAVMTAEELRSLGEDCRAELDRGRMIPMSPAGSEHGVIVLRIGSLVHRFVDEHDLGCAYAAETGFVLSRNPDTVRAPDVAFVARARLQSVGNGNGYYEGAPDLAVEVLSPSNTHVEVISKVADYFGGGTRLVWIVNPVSRRVTIYTSDDLQPVVLQDIDTLDGGEVLPGFSVSVAKLFK